MILGIDEVGRGPWAGPLVIGAVILKDPTATWCEALTDSKKLTSKTRQALSQQITSESAASALGWVSSSELDKYGLSRALCLATRRAVKQILATKTPFDEIIIDGTINFLAKTPLEDKVTTLKKADLLIKEVSAASIIAKVARDEYMINLAEQYPEYGFESHVGYGTAKHRAALQEYGPCPEHRRSFKPVKASLKCYLSGRNSRPSSRGSSLMLLQPSQNAAQKTFSTTSTTSLGARAEGIVAEYLLSEGHRILSRNHKTKFYEIDIISIKDDNIYFTEVKYRKSSARGTPLDQITTKKQQQMHFATEAFLKYQPYLKSLNPHLAVASVSGPDFHLDDWFAI